VDVGIPARAPCRLARHVHVACTRREAEGRGLACWITAHRQSMKAGCGARCAGALLLRAPWCCAASQRLSTTLSSPAIRYWWNRRSTRTFVGTHAKRQLWVDARHCRGTTLLRA
jgi:hypothetical protein